MRRTIASRQAHRQPRVLWPLRAGRLCARAVSRCGRVVRTAPCAQHARPLLALLVGGSSSSGALGCMLLLLLLLLLPLLPPSEPR